MVAVLLGEGVSALNLALRALCSPPLGSVGLTADPVEAHLEVLKKKEKQPGKRWLGVERKRVPMALTPPLPTPPPLRGRRLRVGAVPCVYLHTADSVKRRPSSRCGAVR